MNPPTAPHGRSTLRHLDAQEALTERPGPASRGAAAALRVIPDAHAPRGPRTLRTEPTFVVGNLHKATAAVFRRILPELEGGTLVVSAPDGTQHRFGAGPEQHLVIDDWRALQRVALARLDGVRRGVHGRRVAHRRPARPARPPAVQRRRRRRAPQRLVATARGPSPSATGDRAASPLAGGSRTTTTSATSCSSCSSTRP